MNNTPSHLCRFWYVIQTKPKKEESVLKLLAGAQCETFLPKIKMFRSLSSFFTKPLFPSYLFVRLSPDDKSLLRMVRYTRGVQKILGDEKGPHPVSSEVVNFIKDATGSGDLVEQKLLLKEKTDVRVKRGLFKDLVGILEAPVNDTGRVRVLFKILKSVVRVNLFCCDLEPA